MPGKEPANRGRTRYQSLVEFLAEQTYSAVTLTLADIEKIISAPLSVSASNSSAFWHATTQVHVRQWREMGWEARFDRRNQCVRFTRDIEDD